MLDADGLALTRITLPGKLSVGLGGRLVFVGAFVDVSLAVLVFSVGLDCGGFVGALMKPVKSTSPHRDLSRSSQSMRRLTNGRTP